MTTADPLQHIQRLAIDTAPFIYFIERHPAYLSQMRAVFERITQGNLTAYTSVLTLTEVLVQPLQMHNQMIAESYRTILQHSAHLLLVSITPDVAEQAAQLRAQYHLRTPDSLQVAAALSVGCDAFLTNDNGLRRVQALPILMMDDLPSP